MLSIQPVSRSGLPSSRTRQILGFFRCVTLEMMTPSNETLGMDQTLSPPILLMEEILHQLVGGFSHNLQGFIHPRWCRISSINSRLPGFQQYETVRNLISWQLPWAGRLHVSPLQVSALWCGSNLTFVGLVHKRDASSSGKKRTFLRFWSWQVFLKKRRALFSMPVGGCCFFLNTEALI